MIVHKLVLAVVCGLAAVSFWTLAPDGMPAAEQDKDAVRVGTFERVELLKAFYGSVHWDNILKAKQAERAAAEEKGDLDRVKELEEWGESAQELAHRQLAGEAHLTNILEYLDGHLPMVAVEANVRMIIEKPLYHDGTMVLVDVTPMMVRQLTPKK
jgi:hypothetical protein